MAYPLEDPAVAQKTREVLEVIRYAIALNAPMSPGLVVTGTTSPALNGSYLLEPTLVNGKPWLSTATGQIKARSDGKYTMGLNILGANYWLSDGVYPDPYKIQGWVAVGAPTGSPTVQTVYGLTIDAVPGRQAVYQGDRWFKLVTAGWQKFSEEERFLNLAVETDTAPLDAGAGVMVSGDIPGFAKGLVINAGPSAFSPDTDGRDAYTDTGIIGVMGGFNRRLYFDALQDFWSYEVTLNNNVYAWKYEGTEVNVSTIASWTWESLIPGVTEVPVFELYDEVGINSKVGSTFSVKQEDGRHKIYLCVSSNPIRYLMMPTEFDVYQIADQLVRQSSQGAGRLSVSIIDVADIEITSEYVDGYLSNEYESLSQWILQFDESFVPGDKIKGFNSVSSDLSIIAGANVQIISNNNAITEKRSFELIYLKEDAGDQVWSLVILGDEV